MNYLGQSFSIAKGIECSESDGELILLNVDDEKFYGLDEASKFIWGHLVDGLRLEEIVDKLTDEFDVECEIAQSDIIEFIEMLLSRKLIYPNL